MSRPMIGEASLQSRTRYEHGGFYIFREIDREDIHTSEQCLEAYNDAEYNHLTNYVYLHSDGIWRPTSRNELDEYTGYFRTYEDANRIMLTSG